MQFTKPADSEGLLVTVAMVTYNSSPYVRMAIESVLASSYTNFELLISDDCSADNTWEIIQSYQDTRIRASRNETNLGEYPNRNKCIDLARGEYFLFIDGDDLIYQHGLEIYARHALAFDKPSLIIQKGYYNNLVFPVLLLPEQTFEFEMSDQGLLSSSFSSNFFRTSVLRESGGLNNKFISGDEEIRYKIASRYPVLFISGWLTWPRETPNQASGRLSDGMGLVESYLTFRNLYEILPIEESLKNNRINSLKRMIFKTIIKSVCKFRFEQTNSIFIKSGLTFFQLFVSLFKTRFIRKKISYSPDKPLALKL